MHVLAFDCATQGCSVAVTRQGRLLGRRQVNAERGQSEILLPMIAALMAENGLIGPSCP